MVYKPYLSDSSNDPAPPFSWQEFIETHRWWILTALGGLALVGFGLRYLQTPAKPDRVEFIPTAESAINKTKVVIDVSGSVNKPGVYDLPSGSRIGDAISAAGGLSPSADHQWVERTLNRAEQLRDGQKIYILSLEEAMEQTFVLPKGIIAGTSNVSTISINSANQSGLESLWGVGPVTAQAIIDGRPYSSIEELLNRKIVKQNVWERIKNQVSL
jgi:competence protein ComEA